MSLNQLVSLYRYVFMSHPTDTKYDNGLSSLERGKRNICSYFLALKGLLCLFSQWNRQPRNQNNRVVKIPQKLFDRLILRKGFMSISNKICKGPLEKKSITKFNNFIFAAIFAYSSLIITSNFDKFANAEGNLLQKTESCINIIT